VRDRVCDHRHHRCDLRVAQLAASDRTPRLEDVRNTLTFMCTVVIAHRMNVLLTRDARVKLADFGLSRFSETALNATLKKLRGTMAYFAPECCE
jgi:hypothetical protein